MAALSVLPFNSFIDPSLNLLLIQCNVFLSEGWQPVTDPGFMQICLQDVGQSILESYSRVLESLASTIIARIDDILYADNLVTMSAVPTVPTSGKSGIPHSKRNHGSYTVQLPAVGTPHTTTPFVSHNTSTTPNSNMKSNSVHDVTQGTVLIQGPHLTQVFSDFLSSEKLEMEVKKEQEDLVKIPPNATNTWSYAGELENSNALHSPPSRD